MSGLDKIVECSICRRRSYERNFSPYGSHDVRYCKPCYERLPKMENPYPPYVPPSGKTIKDYLRNNGIDI